MKDLFYVSGEFISPLALIVALMVSMGICLMLTERKAIGKWLRTNAQNFFELF